MKVKLFELRDRLTFIPIIAIDMNILDGTLESRTNIWLLRRCGYPCDGVPNIAISRLAADGTPLSNDPYDWEDRTFTVAHDYIIKKWHKLNDGDVIDVEYILGETDAPKVSEKY